MSAEAKKQPPHFLPKMLNKPCAVKLLTETVLKGKMVGFNAYEVLIEQANGERILLYKHAILYITSPALKDGK